MNIQKYEMIYKNAMAVCSVHITSRSPSVVTILFLLEKLQSTLEKRNQKKKLSFQLVMKLVHITVQTTIVNVVVAGLFHEPV